MAGCHIDSPSHRRYQQTSSTQIFKALCSPLQPANSTVTLSSLPSSHCSTPSIMLYPQNWNCASVSPGFTNNQSCETESHANTPECSYSLFLTPLTPTAPHCTHSTQAALRLQHAPSPPAGPRSRSPPHLLSHHGCS